MYRTSCWREPVSQKRQPTTKSREGECSTFPVKRFEKGKILKWKKLELAGAIRTAYGRIGELGLQEREEFRNWVKYILLSVCGNKEAVVEEIMRWAGDGEDDMAFKYNIIRAFEDERAVGKEEGKEEGMTLKLISLVRKKIHKNKTVEEIAEMLEEEPDAIAPIYELLWLNPDWDDERICSELAGLEKSKNTSER